VHGYEKKRVRRAISAKLQPKMYAQLLYRFTQCFFLAIWLLLWTKCAWYSVANYDRKHLENSRTGLENWIFFSSKRVGTLQPLIIQGLNTVCVCVSSQDGFTANVLANVCLMKHNDRHWINMSTFRRRLGCHAKTLSATDNIRLTHDTVTWTPQIV